MASTTAIVVCFLGLFGVTVIGILATARVKLAQIKHEPPRPAAKRGG